MKKKKNIYKFMEKEIERLVDVHSYDINKPKEEAKRLIREFIEKMAIWYELRYPDCEMKRMFKSSNAEIDITNEIFYNNSNLADVLKNSMTEIDLKWHDFYNYDAFYASLSEEEKCLIKEPSYPRLLYLYNGGFDHIHVSSDGYVEMYEYSVCNGSISIDTDEYKKYDVNGFVKLLEKKGASFSNDSEVICAINSYYNQKILRCNILDLTMYRIMMRGDRNESSLRRAYLFAKEFHPSEIEFIADYAIHYDDINLLMTMSEELKSIEEHDFISDHAIQKYLKLTNLY